MKKIRLRVNGESFVIEECEGDAEIRLERAPKSDAGPRATHYSGTEGRPVVVELAVERLE